MPTGTGDVELVERRVDVGLGRFGRLGRVGTGVGKLVSSLIRCKM